jgi:hypothetical protein
MFRRFVLRGLALLFLVGAQFAGAAEEELPKESATNLSTLGRTPHWSELEKFQATITRDEFVRQTASVS